MATEGKAQLGLAEIEAARHRIAGEVRMTPVLAATSKLGTAVDIASVEKQALAAHAPEGGNNVSIAVYPSPGSLP